MKTAKFSCIASLLSLAFWTACGDNTTTENITQVVQPGVEIVANMSALPSCDSENKGAQVWVKSESSAFVCAGDKWSRVKSESGAYTCETQLLSDSSGIKIVCNGDSVGVLLSGSPGMKGKDGLNTSRMCQTYSCPEGTVESQYTCIKLVCDAEWATFLVVDDDLIEITDDDGKDSGKVVIPPDEDAVTTSLDSMSGYSQKGPFVQGSTVRLYELAGGQTLKQTNGNFTGTINSNDGFFKFSARDLVSQYALLVANGYYRNEVTGETTKEDLTLFALTDVSKRSRANVNLLTHLEYDRVYHLVTKEKMKVKAAKRQAQAEILNAFHIDTTGIGESEDLSVFGAGRGNAALLAISVLLQGMHTIAELTELLSAISSDLEKDGTLEESLRMKIADEAFGLLRLLPKIRANVEGWNLGEVPDFETLVENFVWTEFGIDADAVKTSSEPVLLKNAQSKYDGLYLVYEDDCWGLKLFDARTSIYYKLAVIGSQVWMGEDLLFPSPNSSYTYEWEEAVDLENTKNLDGIVQGICPDGWHIPSKDEWIKQVEHVTEISYYKYGRDRYEIRYNYSADLRLKSKMGWGTGNGTDDFGFSVMPFGYASVQEECSQEYYCYTRYWSSTRDTMHNSSSGTPGVFIREFKNAPEGLLNIENIAGYATYYNIDGPSEVRISGANQVRCIKD